MGRPSKLTPKVHAAIVQSVRNGSYLGPAARAAGVAESTLSTWIAAADPDHERYHERYAAFANDVARAEAEAEATTAGFLASHEDWRARLEWLKRRFKDRWSERAEQTGPEGTAQKVEVTIVDTDAVYRGLVDAGVIQPGPAAAPDPSG